MKPIHTIKDKGLSVAIWKTRNGGYSFSISKRYKDKQTDQWKDSKYLFKDDIESLILQLQAALQYANEAALHAEEGLSSGQSKKGSAANYELTQDEIDDLPF